jgi:hypothetical protein
VLRKKNQHSKTYYLGLPLLILCLGIVYGLTRLYVVEQTRQTCIALNRCVAEYQTFFTVFHARMEKEILNLNSQSDCVPMFSKDGQKSFGKNPEFLQHWIQIVRLGEKTLHHLNTPHHTKIPADLHKLIDTVQRRIKQVLVHHNSLDEIVLPDPKALKNLVERLEKEIEKHPWQAYWCPASLQIGPIHT